MVNQYSSEDNQAIKIPSPPSAVSLAGDSRAPMDILRRIARPSRPQVHPTVSLAGDSREPR